MIEIPEAVQNGWEKRNGPAVFTTVSSSGIPNTIYVGAISLYDSSTIIIADNYFNKTRKNIQEGSSGSFLFITEDNKAFQIKGSIEYHTEGELFDDMKSWNNEKHPGVAAAVIRAEEAYSGAEKLA